MRALTVDEVGVVSGGIFQDGTAYRINGLEDRYKDPFPRNWPLVDFGRAGGHWVQEYYQPPAPGSGQTTLMDVLVATGEFMSNIGAGIAFPPADAALVYTGPNFLYTLANFISGK